MSRFILAVALAACGLLAQTEAPPQLVYLYPVALDSSGQPITDLTSDDFKITDQGKAETALFFRAPRTDKPAPLGPHEYTNRPDGVAPHPMVVLFDLLNETRPNWLDAWHSLAKSLVPAELTGSLYFYVLNLDGDLVPIREIGSNAVADLDKVMAAASTIRPAGFKREDEVKKAYHSLEVIANQLAALPGRAEIVWITNVMPFILPPIHCNGDWLECGLYVAHLAVALEHDSVTVHPAYLSGDLQAQVGYDIEQLALLTGGRVHFREDIRTILQRVARDAAAAYEIAYAPAAENWDNKFHKIRVTSPRRGVKLQVRERYYALPDSRPPAARQMEKLNAANLKPADATDIGLRVKVSPGAKGVHLEVRIDPSDLLVRTQDGKRVGAVTLLVSDRGGSDKSDDTGLLVRPLGDPSVSKLDLELTHEGITVSFDHPLTDAVQRVRVLLMDRRTNAVGSVTFPRPV